MASSSVSSAALRPSRVRSRGADVSGILNGIGIDLREPAGGTIERKRAFTKEDGTRRVKAEFVRRMIDAGLDTIETTSFVPPSWIPQLSDATELVDALGQEARRATRPVLVPNERGLDNALAAGVKAIAVFGSATEAFAQKNLNRGREEQFEMFTSFGLWF